MPPFIRNTNPKMEINHSYSVQVTPVLSICGGQDDAIQGGWLCLQVVRLNYCLVTHLCSNDSVVANTHRKLDVPCYLSNSRSQTCVSSSVGASGAFSTPVISAWLGDTYPVA